MGPGSRRAPFWGSRAPDKRREAPQGAGGRFWAPGPGARARAPWGKKTKKPGAPRGARRAPKKRGKTGGGPGAKKGRDFWVPRGNPRDPRGQRRGAGGGDLAKTGGFPGATENAGKGGGKRKRAWRKNFFGGGESGGRRKKPGPF